MFNAIALIGTVFVTPPVDAPPQPGRPVCEITLTQSASDMTVLEALLTGAGWDGGRYVMETRVTNGSNVSRSVQSGEIPSSASARLPVSLARVQTLLPPGTSAEITLRILEGDRVSECHRHFGP